MYVYNRDTGVLEIEVFNGETVETHSEYMGRNIPSERVEAYALDRTAEIEREISRFNKLFPKAFRENADK